MCLVIIHSVVLQHREANALTFWESAVAERRRQQKHIVGKGHANICIIFLAPL